MSQDLQRWRNQNFSCSVYNTRNHGGGFLVEAINVDKPVQRAYMQFPSFMGMRGQILKYYIDAELKIIGVNDEQGINAAGNQDQSIGFGDEHVIERIDFRARPEEFRKRMNKDPKYYQWQYEKLGQEEVEAGYAEPPKNAFN